jgi:GNAT superfamily N-acetyltransferase
LKRTLSGKSRTAVTIRKAGPADTKALVELSAQLGYELTSRQVAAELKRISSDKSAEVFVAEMPGRGVVGWIQFFEQVALAGGHRIEIAGLVVDDSSRGTGIGRALMSLAEARARKLGCSCVYLRTNVKRAAAHIFYERLGYTHIKTQKAYRKAL